MFSKKAQKKIFSRTLDWINERIDMGRLNQTSSDLLDIASGTLREEIREYFKSQKKYNTISSALTSAYYDYLKNGISHHKGISKVKFNQYKKDFRKELENRIGNSFQLMKNRDNEIIAGLSSRFINWVTIDSPEVRSGGTNTNSLLDFLRFGEENQISSNHLKFIINDQKHKMRHSFDFLLAQKNKAIACIWHNRRDKRVVGNPAGIYPDSGNKAHGDHWVREGKIYILKNSWAYEKGYIKGAIYEDLEDGGAGVAIGCRCWLEYIYDLEYMPKENLTQKGKEALIA